MAGGIGGKGTDRLSDREIQSWIKAAGRGEVPKKLSDGQGMFLTLTAAGTPVWRVKYRLDRTVGEKPLGREKKKTGLISLGQYPEVGLKAARAERAIVRALVREGKNPAQARRVVRASAVTSSGNTFGILEAAWLAKNQPGWKESHYEGVVRQLERYAKSLRRLPVAEITDPMVGELITHVVEKRDSIETAKKLQNNLQSIFRYAKARGFCTHNPAESAKELIPRRRLTGRRPAFLDWAPLGELLRNAGAAHLSRAVHMAHRLCAFTAARVGNVIAAEWSEFGELDADVPTWVIPRTKMKAQDRHHDFRVILGPSIAEEIRAWRRVSGAGRYLFPSPTDPAEHITSESLSKLYRVTLGLKDKHTPHGWRASFSTLANDNKFDPTAVEMALDHVHANEVVRAYDRADRRHERVRLAIWWNTELVKAERGGAT